MTLERNMPLDPETPQGEEESQEPFGALSLSGNRQKYPCGPGMIHCTQYNCAGCSDNPINQLGPYM